METMPDDLIVRKGDIDKPIRFIIEFDPTAYAATTDFVCRIRRPDGTFYNADASKFSYDAPSRQFQIKTSTAELTSTGIYVAQLKAAKGGQPTQYTGFAHFHVEDIAT